MARVLLAAPIVAALFLTGAFAQSFSFDVVPNEQVSRYADALERSTQNLNESRQDPKSSKEWDALFVRTQGWLGADGIYSLDLNRDSLSDQKETDKPALNLFWFSDTFWGQTRHGGKEYGERKMINHSFAVLQGTEPEPDNIDFICNREQSALYAENVIPGHYWLQDGIRLGSKIWISAILVGDAWKPQRIDALTIDIDPATGRPDFSTAKVDVQAPLSIKTDDAILDWGVAICDESNDGYVYVYGYVDRLREFSRKDLVAARVPRDRFLEYDCWRYYDGKSWSDNPNVVFNPHAALARSVSTEFSVTPIPFGKERGKYLLVYTPGTIGSKIAYRVADSPVGPFSAEIVFYESKAPQELPGVRCYNAKAHPIFANEKSLLVSYNVNRLGDMAHKPAEYRPRFVWLDWNEIETGSR